MAVAALTMFAACDNSMYEYEQLFPDKYKRVVCIQTAAEGDLTIYNNLPNNTEFPMTVLRSGGIPEGEAKVNLVPMTQEELSQYEADGVLLSSEFYSVPNNLTFESEQRYTNIKAVFTPEQVSALKAEIEAVKAADSSKDVYMAFKLEQVGETTIDAEKFYLLRKLEVKEPEIRINLNDFEKIWGSKKTFTVELPFENIFDIAYELKVVAVDNAEIDSDMATFYEAWNSLGIATDLNTSEVIDLTEEAVTGFEVQGMSAGTSTVEYTIQVPAEYANGAYTIGIQFGNATINGGPLVTNKCGAGETWTGVVGFQARPGYDHLDNDNGGAPYVALQGMGMTLNPYYHSPESSNPNGDDIQTLLQDGNSGTFWDNNWGGGYGVKTHTYETAIDFGSTVTISAVELWRRAGTYVTDFRTMDVYAATTLDYSNKEDIKYNTADLTYLGTIDFAAGDKRAAQFMKLKPATTQYLLLCTTRAGRNNCIGIAELGFFSPAAAE